MLQWVLAAILRMLNSFKGVGALGVDGLLTGSKVMLFTNNITPTPGAVLADLTEATYTGYARSAALTWGTPFVSNLTGKHVMQSGMLTFAGGVNAGGEAVRGYALISGEGTPVLLALKRLEGSGWTPAPGSSLVLLPRVAVSDLGPVPDNDPALS